MKPIPVAFPISGRLNVMDFAGPWEVFYDCGEDAFQLYTVAETTAPVDGEGGFQLIPNYTFEDAPRPAIVVIPSQNGSEAMLDWIRKQAATADLIMSVCTGAFVLARTGLLRTAATHHCYYERFDAEFPQIELKRDCRFVEDGKVASAAGLTSGIDLALRVVERYCGREAAVRTADFLEYPGTAWR